MPRSRKRQRPRTAVKEQAFRERCIQETIEEYQLRRATHIAEHGSSSIHPASTAWIDLPIGSPARQYLDAYITTGDLPDIRTAEDPVAANEVWDYLENHEAAGTLPLCIPPLSFPVDDSWWHLVEEAARQEGIDPAEIIDVRMRSVRSHEAYGGENGGPAYVFDFVLAEATLG